MSRFIDETSPGRYCSIGLFVVQKNNQQYNQLCINGLDNNGQITWEKKYGDSSFVFLQLDLVTRQAIKYQNHFYYTGVVRQGNEQNGILLKIDFNGNIIWQKIFKELNRSTATQAITPSLDGGFLLAGFSDNTMSTFADCPALLIKTDSNGNLLWKKKFNKSGYNITYGRTVIQDPIFNNIIIAGDCSVDDPYSFYPMMIVADSLGNLIEQRILIEDEEGFMLDIARLADSTLIMVGGATTGALDVSGALPLYNSVQIQLEPFLTTGFIKHFDRDSPINYFTTILVDTNGIDYYTGGAIDTNMQYFPPYVRNDMFRLSKFNSKGILKENRYYSYTNYVDTNKPYFENGLICNHLARTSEGGFLAAIKFNTYTVRTPLFNVKLDVSGCDTTLAYCMNPTNNVVQKRNECQVKIYPNPTTSKIVVDRTDDYVGTSTAQVFDQTHAVTNIIYLISTKTTIDLSSIPPGLYFLRLSTETGSYQTKKVMIVR